MSSLEEDVCPICHSGKIQLFFKSQLDFSLRSDWTVLPQGAEVYQCLACDHLFKPNSLTRKWSDYQNYSVLDNDPQMDKMDFSGAHPVSRSAAVIQYLHKMDCLTEKSKILDYGCNRGAFLALLRSNSCDGYDVSEHYRPIIENLKSRYFTPSIPPTADTYDLLTLLHVAEHLDPMDKALENGLRALKPDGNVLIQVPDVVTQPTDLYVMDHCSHFFPQTLDRAMSSLNLSNKNHVEKILPGELTGLYEKSEKDLHQDSARVDKREITGIQESLTFGEGLLSSIQKAGKPCAVYGAGLLGSLLGAVLNDQLIAFIDDNKGLQGRKLAGKPVVALESPLRQNISIVVGVPPSAARQVEEKCQRTGFRVEVPFRPAKG